MSEWLNKLKAGDPVAIESGFGNCSYSLSVVERVTATQFIVNQSRYRRRDGRRIGDGDWQQNYLVEPTAEIRETIRKDFLCAKLSQVNWSKIGVETLEEIYAKAKNGQHLEPKK